MGQHLLRHIENAVEAQSMLLAMEKMFGGMGNKMGSVFSFKSMSGGDSEEFDTKFVALCVDVLPQDVCKSVVERIAKGHPLALPKIPQLEALHQKYMLHDAVGGVGAPSRTPKI